MTKAPVNAQGLPSGRNAKSSEKERGRTRKRERRKTGTNKNG